ncbi:MAG: hypothetical protein LBI82_05325 [Dysgonamonadaceae bacterium]|jgi:hypothetical protein|nr:hypothetical protein [Dysgonamonadaceae bacterium]
MNAKKILIICICLISKFTLSGQNITVIEQNETFTVSEKQKEFYYIEKDFSLTDDGWIATLEGFCTNTKKSNLEHLFYDFWETANAMGANAFFIEDFSNAMDTIFVVISIFNLTEKELDDNYELYSCNKIYVFGDLITSNFNTKIPKSRNISVNKEKVKVYPLSYYEYQSDINEKVNISIGGILGSGYIRKGETGKVSAYLSLGGGTIRPAITPMGGVGVNFSTGSIYPLDMNFGQFLAEILQ